MDKQVPFGQRKKAKKKSSGPSKPLEPRAFGRRQKINRLAGIQTVTQSSDCVDVPSPPQVRSDSASNPFQMGIYLSPPIMRFGQFVQIKVLIGATTKKCKLNLIGRQKLQQQ